MDYYYADNVNSVCGPVSEEVLRNLYFQCRITLDSQVMLKSTPDWRRLRDSFPDLEFYRGCPKCTKKITIEAVACPHCRFGIAKYEINLRDARRRPITAIKVTEAQIQPAIRAELAGYNGGCFLIIIVCLSFFLCLIPIIGIFIGALTFLCALAAFLSPIRLKLWWYENYNPDALVKLRDNALTRLTSPFLGECPKCKKQISELAAANETAAICPHCSTPLHRQKSYIYHIPHQAELLSSDFSILFPNKECA